MYRLVGCALKFRTRSRARPWTAGLQTPRQPEVPIPTFESNSRNTVSGLTLLPSPNRGRVRAKRGGRTETAASLSCADPQKGNGLVWRGQKRGRGAYRCRTTTQPCRLPDAPERIRTSTTYSGHKALNLVRHGLELTDVSICGDVSGPADALGLNGRAFVATAVITLSNRARCSGSVSRSHGASIQDAGWRGQLPRRSRARVPDWPGWTRLSNTRRCRWSSLTLTTGLS